MKVFILGATGALGRTVTKLALEKGIDVKAFVRNPAKVSVQNSKLEIVQGNILNESDVNNAIKGVDAVIWTIGHENKKAAKKTMAMDTCSRGSRYVINAMNTHNLKRFIAVSSWGVGEDNRKRTPLFFKHFIFRFVLNKEFADKEKQEEIIRSSNTDYTIIRPSRLTNSVKNCGLQVGHALHYSHFSNTPRALLADFILKIIRDNSFVRETVEVSC
ncbi:MAG: SDR family oxidoreductase [Bacteroidota bacterium]|nr:SDR family oxidoreductase [Bacteroidota bacterium]